MNFDFISSLEFFYSLGYITLGSSVMTLFFTFIFKRILKGMKVIKDDMNSIRKDIILSRVGRIIALISYASLYVIDAMFIKKINIVFDMELITSLVSGGSLTLIISKGIYTAIRQMEKKKSILEKFEAAELTIKELENDIKESGLVDSEKIFEKDIDNKEEKNRRIILGKVKNG